MLFRCIRCLYPNTKPDLHFNAEGICSACQAFEARQRIDWKAKEVEFLDYVRSHQGSTHDCIVAVSGGKDSTSQVVKCLELGLRPLAVCATTDHLSSIGRRNLDNLSELCDVVEVTANKPTRRKIARFALEEVGDISWCEHHLIWSVPARESIARNIPVILYGECPQNEYGAGPQGTETAHRLTKGWVDEFGGLLGLRLSDVADILGIDVAQLEPYRYPCDAERVHSLFMGSFFDWDGRRNAEIAFKHGFRTFHTRVEGTCADFENLDNAQTGLHDWLRWLKFGYGRTADIASSWIRRGYIDRPTGAVMSLKYDGQFPETYLGIPVDDVIEPLGLTRKELDAICERFTNKPVVEWASSQESYQSFSTTSTDALREKDSTQAAA
jgi:N-acetyl sugar amidotransferase